MFSVVATHVHKHVAHARPPREAGHQPRYRRQQRRVEHDVGVESRLDGKINLQVARQQVACKTRWSVRGAMCAWKWWARAVARCGGRRDANKPRRFRAEIKLHEGQRGEPRGQQPRRAQQLKKHERNEEHEKTRCATRTCCNIRSTSGGACADTIGATTAAQTAGHKREQEWSSHTPSPAASQQSPRLRSSMRAASRTAGKQVVCPLRCFAIFHL